MTDNTPQPQNSVQDTVTTDEERRSVVAYPQAPEPAQQTQAQALAAQKLADPMSLAEILATDPYAQQLLSHIAGLSNGTATPRQDTVDSQANPLLEELNSLKAAYEQLKAHVASNLADAVPNPGAPAGGAPVAHHLHLDDGTVVKDFEGIATHFQGADGILHKVLHYVPSLALKTVFTGLEG